MSVGSHWFVCAEFESGVLLEQLWWCVELLTVWCLCVCLCVSVCVRACHCCTFSCYRINTLLAMFLNVDLITVTILKIF